MPDNRMGPLATLLLPPGAKIVLEALDPVTGANLSSVVISEVVISGEKPAAGELAEVISGQPFYTAGMGG